jgi:hypothetical protein
MKEFIKKMIYMLNVRLPMEYRLECLSECLVDLFAKLSRKQLGDLNNVERIQRT